MTSKARNCGGISMASPFVAPQFKLAICAILVLPFLFTTATAADIFLDWHVSTDFNLKPVSTDQPVWIISTFHLFIFYFSYSSLVAHIFGR